MKTISTYFLTVAALLLSGAVFAQPANNDCAGAVTLTQGATCQGVSGDVAGATQSMAPCTGSDANDVWYKFTNTTADLNLEVTGSASFDVVFEVFSGTCASLTSVVCEDNFSNGTESTEADQLTVGTEFFIRVYDFEAGTPATTNFEVCVFNAPLGIKDNAVAAFSVFPNPSNDRVRIDLGSPINNSTINLFNMVGELVQTQQVNGTTFVDYQLPETQGVYLIQLVDANGTASTVKVIKE